MLNNLLANAARHSPAASVVRIEGVRQDAFVAISVTDRGAGIPPDRLPHLFRKQVSGAVGERSTGLGLAISKGLVQAHGGRIRAESAGAGHGARFTFTLPVAERRPETPPETTVHRGHKQPILVLDDDPQSLIFARKALAEAGFVPLVASDPSELPQVIRSQRPCLVLLDLLLRDADGIELMAQMPELADLPVIFVSVYGRDETIARALEAGAADYIVKPFSPTELVARIRAVLRRHAEPEMFQLRELVIRYEERRATLAGQTLTLTAREYDLLRVLATNAGRVATYEELQRQVWGGPEHANSSLVRTFIMKLRKKLRDDSSKPVYVLTERGVGYRMPRPGDT